MLGLALLMVHIEVDEGTLYTVCECYIYISHAWHIHRVYNLYFTYVYEEQMDTFLSKGH